MTMYADHDTFLDHFRPAVYYFYFQDGLVRHNEWPIDDEDALERAKQLICDLVLKDSGGEYCNVYIPAARHTIDRGEYCNIYLPTTCYTVDRGKITVVRRVGHAR